MCWLLNFKKKADNTNVSQSFIHSVKYKRKSYQILGIVFGTDL
jgi:hypothetical protein